MRFPTRANFLLSFLGVFVVTHQAASANLTLAPGVLVNAVLNLNHKGAIYSGTINPPYSGAYLFEVAYAISSERLDAKITGDPRKFAQPYHESCGGRIRITVVESTSGRQIAPVATQWVPMQITTSKQSETCVDRLDYILNQGTVYEIQVLSDELLPTLQDTNPRFVVEAANSTRLDLISNRYWQFLVAAMFFIVFICLGGIMFLVLRRIIRAVRG